MKIRVGHFPQAQGEDIEYNLRSIDRMSFTVGGMTEMATETRSWIGPARAILGRHHVLAPGEGGRSKEVPALLRRDPRIKIESVRTRQISPKLAGDDLGNGWGNDRYMTVLRYRTRALRKKNRHRLFHVQTHWNAVIQNDDGTMKDNRRALWAAKSGILLNEVLIRLINKEGREGTVAGDFNWQDENVYWKWSPDAIASRNKMRSFHCGGPDWILWTNGLKRDGEFDVIPKNTARNKADHPWFLGNLEL